ncbi:uncharacterized protein LOC134851881 [Symsagittifera roscoffensis]|uniref:uncharacterized protein LOC134851881 n=1 Tax=Symsagittifera roscoffensis TaxID=84072 RepID=UPI00307B9A58
MVEDMLMNYMFYGSGDTNPVDVQECKENMKRVKYILLTIVLVALVVAQVMAHSNVKLVETHIDQLNEDSQFFKREQINMRAGLHDVCPKSWSDAEIKDRNICEREGGYPSSYFDKCYWVVSRNKYDRWNPK